MLVAITLIPTASARMNFGSHAQGADQPHRLQDAVLQKVALFISSSMEGMTMFVGHGKVWNDSIQHMANIATMSFLQLVKNITPETIEQASLEAPLR